MLYMLAHTIEIDLLAQVEHNKYNITSIIMSGLDVDL